MNIQEFDYQTAFSRNLGWLTETEQILLKSKRIAIAGMGGVGGTHLLTLTRLGIGAFHIADLDVFEQANFNRQAGAMTSTLDHPKAEVLARMAKDINPALDLKVFNEGVQGDNLDAFLEGVDLFVDGLDFFAPQIRAQVFARCRELGIPAITAGPIGMGTAYLIFTPDGMSFEDYFRMAGLSVEQQYVNFLVGLTPSGFHRDYLVDPQRLNLAEKRGPSTIMACQLCAGVTGTEAVKILLNRGPIHPAPYYHVFDAYRPRYRRGRLRWGNRGPLQTLKCKLGYRQVARLLAAPARASTDAATPELPKPLATILSQARWAPSGDNTQPWRFEIHDDTRFTIHGHDTRDHVVYDLRGRASQIALGGLLETLDIAAATHGFRCDIQRRLDAPENRPTFDVQLIESPARSHPLAPFIAARSTQRRSMQRRPLTSRHRDALEAAVGPDHYVVWLQEPGERRRMARLLWDNALVRLTTPEAYPVHSSIIDWNAQYSTERIPDQALGMDPLGLKLMRWALASWQRVHFLNRYLGGTLLPRLQMDLLPALNCGAHFVIVSRQPLTIMDDYIAGGRAMQRFWLTATRLGLQFQPEMTPLIFASYVHGQVEFSRESKSMERAVRLTRDLQALAGETAVRQGVFMGRVGYGPNPAARSLRLPLSKLLTSSGHDKTIS
ncbi:ThiF family adenylyltransferase [Ectothiorhodospira shaposhnikovii]|nr:ThiF family adenylyltransferase [Ectothiorhodospira shaposhnikovii]MCG5512186.1 ThiF family adenylyltransferase [Ectothiorhodospira shaposhnikovii]